MEVTCRIVSIDAGSVQYVYDAFGRRVEKNVSGIKDDYVYDLSGNVVADIDGSNGNWKRGEIWAGRHLATYTGGASGTTYFNHQDWLGSERVRSDASGAIAQTCTDQPYGDALSCSGSAGTTPISTYNFAGMEYDSETGFYHTQYRYYNPKLGGWMTPDPAGLAAADLSNPQSLNRYAYALNNPVSFIDRYGLYCAYYLDDDSGIESIDDNSNAGECGETGGEWYEGGWAGSSIDVNTDVSQVPTLADDFSFFQMWNSGTGPSSINYGPNDGMTKQLATSATFDNLREKYRQQGCPNSGDPISGGDHVTPLKDEIRGNWALVQVGGFSAYGQTNGNVTTFTIVNTAGQASFSGATAFGPALAAAAPTIATAINPGLGLLIAPFSANGVKDNPYGPQGPSHNITQTFTWTENNVCR